MKNFSTSQILLEMIRNVVETLNIQKSQQLRQCLCTKVSHHKLTNLFHKKLIGFCIMSSKAQLGKLAIMIASTRLSLDHVM